MDTTQTLSPPTTSLTGYNNNKVLVIIGLMLVVCLSLLSIHIYGNYNVVGNKTLSIEDTIRNIFKLPNKIISKTEINKSMGELNTKAINIEKKIIKEIEKPFKPRPTKEVFNIDNNDFTYDEAHLMCKSIGSKLATYEQVSDAYEKGANWCNYGWSADSLALYPTQEKFWEKLQKKHGGKHRNKCGKPGINGGFFPDKSLRLGVNCYGHKPKPDKTKINYLNDKCDVEQKIMAEYKKKYQEGVIEVKPFNKSQWSKFSIKKSRYINTPKYDEDIIVEKEVDKIEHDPNNYQG